MSWVVYGLVTTYSHDGHVTVTTAPADAMDPVAPDVWDHSPTAGSPPNRSRRPGKQKPGKS